MRPRRLKNLQQEAAQFRRRALVALAGVVLGLGGVAAWYFNLQVVRHDEFATRSEQNRIKLKPVVPGRGLIFDRKGRVLADNVPAWRLEVTLGEAGDPAGWLPELARVVDLGAEDIDAFHKARRGVPGFRTVPLKVRLSEEEVARFAVERWRFPGVEVVSYLNRRYLHGELFAHVIGYVGRVDEDELASLGPEIVHFSHTGKTGLERAYEPALRGQVGHEKVETNVEGRPMRLLGQEPARPGADLRLSLDLDLQRAMAAAFGEQEGSAVAIDPRTGQVLAMVSLPSYDTNLFVNGISHAQYDALTSDPSRPLFNRNVLGGGPPGSTVKPMIALAGLDYGLRTPEQRFFSSGEFHIPGQARGYRDAARGGHGWHDLRESIAWSVNTYYYQLAMDMGIDRLSAAMRRFGFGEKTGIDLVGESRGSVPSRDYKRSVSTEPWYPGETVIAGIGQGYWVATALQLARATAAIADGGRLHELRLVAARRDGYGAPWRELGPTAVSQASDDPAHVRVVQEGMIATMHGARGSGRRAAVGAGYTMAGKTGTAQRSSRRGNISADPRTLPYHLRHTALFVGYAPAEDPQIAVAVMVEHGGYGGSAAAPIARQILDAWLLGKMPEGLEPDAVAEPGP
ncbi:penicillin-binding protein 2 [Lysobacter sp. GX 14042]|uniref:penicillin-binding protein 2 n=1 Tax=Lysobacter sp. GX 14042 TaxID=2907155 RepID=UPI001F259A1C|nr:penicillin-binding protein 2 [Lysobacter sp. GX 14042]MCE7032056.1 penicillin-binding protein 2 [Lysobacter sp. GX 14042]